MKYNEKNKSLNKKYKILCSLLGIISIILTLPKIVFIFKECSSIINGSSIALAEGNLLLATSEIFVFSLYFAMHLVFIVCGFLLIKISKKLHYKTIALIPFIFIILRLFSLITHNLIINNNSLILEIILNTIFEMMLPLIFITIGNIICFKKLNNFNVYATTKKVKQ